MPGSLLGFAPPMPQSVQMPSSAPNSPEYVFALEKRIMYLESQVPLLLQYLLSAKLSQEPAFRLPNTALISPSFMSRAFAVWGHYFVAQLIILIPLYVLIFILGMSAP